MPNVIAALPNIGGALCSTPQSLADDNCWSACSNAAKTRNPLKFAGVLQTTGPISAASGPKFTILLGHLEEILLLNIFPIVDMCLSCKDIARQSCTMVRRRRIFGDFFASSISPSRVQHLSDLHPKFALRPSHVWNYGRYSISEG